MSISNYRLIISRSFPGRLVPAVGIIYHSESICTTTEAQCEFCFNRLTLICRRSQMSVESPGG